MQMYVEISIANKGENWIDYQGVNVSTYKKYDDFKYSNFNAYSKK